MEQTFASGARRGVCNRTGCVLDGPQFDLYTMPTASPVKVAPDPRGRFRVLFAVGSGVGIVVLVMALPAAGLVVIAAGVAAWLMARPTLGFAVFVWLLPFHILIMAVLYGGLGVPGSIVRGIAAWKETLVALLLAVTIIRGLAGRVARTFIVWLDLAVGALLLISVTYLVAVNPWSGRDLPLVAQAYGFRDSVYFTLLYFVGRSSFEIVKDRRALRWLYLVGVVTSFIGVLERFLVPPEALVLLGASSYFQDFLGVAAYTQSNAFGLPTNFWTMIGGHLVRRIGSTALSSQGFAIRFLLIMPAATVFALVLARRSVAVVVGYALLWIALVLSITRMTIAACVIQLLLLAVLLRRWSWIAGLTAASVVVFAAVLVAVPGLANFLWGTLTFGTSSGVTHLESWASGLVAMVQYPLGLGLGSADQTATRFGLEWITGDNQYLKYGVELGLIGMLTHILILVGIAAYAARVFFTSADETVRIYGAVVLAVTVGITVNSMTAVVNNSMVLTYPYYWLAGATVTMSQVGGIRTRAGTATDQGAAGKAADQTRNTHGPAT